jgi:hypothetical protein
MKASNNERNAHLRHKEEKIPACLWLPACPIPLRSTNTEESICVQAIDPPDDYYRGQK